MSSGWNQGVVDAVGRQIVTDWDMSSGWNNRIRLRLILQNCNRLGYELWLEQNGVDGTWTM